MTTLYSVSKNNESWVIKEFPVEETAKLVRVTGHHSELGYKIQHLKDSMPCRIIHGGFIGLDLSDVFEYAEKWLEMEALTVKRRYTALERDQRMVAELRTARAEQVNGEE